MGVYKELVVSKDMNKQLMNKEIQMNLEWLTGFIDAGGNFQRTIEKRITKTKGVYYKISYNFHLSLSYVDKELLLEIKEFLNMGKIYLYPHRKEAHFAVYRKAELERLVCMLSEYNFLTRNQSDNFLLLKWDLFKDIKRA